MTLEAVINRRNQEITALGRFLCRVTIQAPLIADLVLDDQVSVVRKNTCLKVIQGQADSIDLISLKDVRFFCVIYNMAADAATPGELGLHLLVRASTGALEGRRSANLDFYWLFFTPR